MGLFNFYKSKPKQSTPFSGGTGKTQEDAIIITASSSSTGILAEYACLEAQCGRKNTDWTMGMQFLVEGDDGKNYDVWNVKLKDGTERTFFFDVSSFMGKF